MRLTFMRYLFIIVFFFLAQVNFSIAQSFHYGIKEGVNESTFSPFNAQNYTSSFITGVHTGVFAEFRYSKISFQPELLYYKIGGKSTYSSDDGSQVSIKYKLSYLRIPFNLIYNLVYEKESIFWGGGPYLGIGVSGKTNTTTNNDLDTTPTVNQESRYDFNKYSNPDFGMNILTGVRFRNKVILALSYEYGFRHVFTNEGAKNNVVSLSVGYEFL
jgi:hypothetical protein